jgi:hypothetical protein
MRIHEIAGAAICIAAGAGCSSELARRPPANDPTSVMAAEAPYRRPPSYQPDPLLTVTPPGNPSEREEPAAQPAPHHDHGGTK